MPRPLPPELEKLSSSMAHLWAKSPKEGETEGYPLFLHTLDVCFQCAEFYHRDNPVWPIADGVDLRRILAYAALLHDFGKVHPEFQLVLRSNGRIRFNNRHEVLSLAFIEWLEVPEVELPWLQCSIAFHHRGFSKLFARGPDCKYSDPSNSEYVRDLANVPDQDSRLLWQVLREADTIFRHTGWNPIDTYQVRDFTGSVSRKTIERPIREIQSFVKVFKRPTWGTSETSQDSGATTAAIATRGLLINADHLASFGKRSLASAIVNRDHTVSQFARGWEPASHQRQLLQVRGSACLVAPTGSGKTEAALFWAASQFETAEANGRVCFVLPYQAAMNAMQSRLASGLGIKSSQSASDANKVVALIHGRSARNLFEKLLKQEYIPREAGQIARNGDSLGRLHAAPIAIFSPYAIIRTLFSSTPEPLMQAYSGARFILDEIHAYEPQVTALTLAALRSLCDRMGARVLFMTATLPKHLRDSLSTALGRFTDVKPGTDVTSHPPRHWIRLLRFHSLSEPATRIIQGHAGMGSVLVVVNQVNRARALAAALQQSGFDISLLHSRFTQEDRARKENQLRPQAGQIVVATQVVEVSLDVSFDYCFTELAPAEAILQRFGRCNRKGGYVPTAANCFVFLEFPSTGRNPHRPYQEQHLNHFALMLQEKLNDRQVIEGDLQELIDSSYPDEMKKALATAIATSVQELQRAIVNRFQPFGIASSTTLEELDRIWEQLFDGQEVLPKCLSQRARAEEHWLGRARYLIPISSYLHKRLNPEPDAELNCDVVDVPYDPELGLEA